MPTVIGGKYRVTGVLGEGGMGAVYVAENTWTRRMVAVKVMHPANAENPAFVQRFLREAQAAAQLDHPNIVDVLDMGQDPDEGGFFIVQEFLTGRDLRARLRAARRLSPREALDIVLPVLEGLAAAHAKGIVHRDLKPENIFLAESARGTVPKVIDFGIAKVTSSEGDGLLRTSTGQVIGTPCYMSPEQAGGESDLDARSDVWSMGVVLYELLSGTLPFTADRFGRLVAEIIMGSPRPLAEVAPHLPSVLVDVVHGALRPRDERHASMMAFHSALTAVRAVADATPDVPYVSPPTPVPAATTSAPLRFPAAITDSPIGPSRPEPSVVLVPDPPPGEARGSTGLHWSGRTRPTAGGSPRRVMVATVAGSALVTAVALGLLFFHRPIATGVVHPAVHTAGGVPSAGSQAVTSLAPSPPVVVPPSSTLPAVPAVPNPPTAPTVQGDGGTPLVAPLGAAVEATAGSPVTETGRHGRPVHPTGPRRHPPTGPGFEAE